MALSANKRNYKKAFTTHANSYDKLNIGAITAVVCCYATALNVD